MPELPEVETIRRDLVTKILNKKIVHVDVRNNISVGGMSTQFVQALKGNAISAIDRRGKLMIWHLSRLPSLQRRGTEGEVLLVHLKMTGQLIYEKEARNKVEIVAGGHKLSEADIECLPNKWTRVVFVFADGSQLFFNDLRLFGYMKLASQAEVDRALKKYGPEPIDTSPQSSPLRRGGRAKPLASAEERAGERSHRFTFAYFSSLFKKRAKTSVKALLLNQELIAGLGNIYVDEVCFAAGVTPMRRVGLVTKAEQKKLFLCIPKILTEALKHRGTTFRNFLDSSGRKGNYTDFLKVYDRDGKPCKKCRTLIIKTKAAQRGTHYCPKCQR